MKKLFYIKCRSGGDSWICDVTNTFLEAHKLLKEYQMDDANSKFKIMYSPGQYEIVRTWFNKERLDKYLNPGF